MNGKTRDSGAVEKAGIFREELKVPAELKGGIKGVSLPHREYFFRGFRYHFLGLRRLK
jgi:hypothetical protein